MVMSVVSDMAALGGEREKSQRLTAIVSTCANLYSVFILSRA